MFERLTCPADVDKWLEDDAVLDLHPEFAKPGDFPLWSMLRVQLRLMTSEFNFLTCNIEHPAITECLEALRAAGRLEVSYVPVDEEGRVAAAAVAAALTEHTVLVTVMHSNNEVGEP